MQYDPNYNIPWYIDIVLTAGIVNISLDVYKVDTFSLKLLTLTVTCFLMCTAIRP